MSTEATVWAWKQSIPATQKIVLLSMADRAGEDFRCWPSIKRLCRDTALAERTVQQAVTELETHGLIRRELRSGRATIYALVGIVPREDTSANLPPTLPADLPADTPANLPPTAPVVGSASPVPTPAGYAPPQDMPPAAPAPTPAGYAPHPRSRCTLNLKENLKRISKSESARRRVAHTVDAAVAPDSAQTRPAAPAAAPVFADVPYAAPPAAESAESALAAPSGPQRPAAQAAVKSAAQPAPQEHKHSYGEYGNVLLSEAEHSRLVQEYGEDEALAAITFLDLHLGASKKRDPYKSHYLAMRKWVFAALAEQRRKSGILSPQSPWPVGGPSFDDLTVQYRNAHKQGVES